MWLQTAFEWKIEEATENKTKHTELSYLALCLPSIYYHEHNTNTNTDGLAERNAAIAVRRPKPFFHIISFDGKGPQFITS